MQLLQRPRTPLVVRGSTPRTFRGMGLFVEVSLLFMGVYVLAQALINPLTASQLDILGGALILSVAAYLLLYLLWPKPKEALRQRERRRSGQVSRVVYYPGADLQNKPETTKPLLPSS